MPLIETKGAASAQGFGEFAKTAVANYIEDVFSTYLYTGNGSTQTITNGIDLSTKGGLVWTKSRSTSYNNALQDTVRGRNNILFSNDSVANQAYSTSINSFNADGYTLGSETLTNQNGTTYVGWTFRKQAKFFDVVTYTGDGNSSRTVSHNLGSVPGCIIVKSVSAANDWAISHRSLTDQIGFLNRTWEFGASAHLRNSLWTSTTFTPGNAAVTNQSGVTYVAYLFAHDAGGFGLTGTDNVISCGSYTGNGSATGPTVTLGYEPQWVLIKNASYTGSYWMIYDNMRGWPVGSNPNLLYPNVSDAEANASWAKVDLLPTGFQIKTTDSWLNQSSDTYIYIAIRRGPMKTPTSGTSVFSPLAFNTTAGTVQTTNFPIDTQMLAGRPGASVNTQVNTRLIGVSTSDTGTTTPYLITSSTGAEQTLGDNTQYWNNTGFKVPNYWASFSSISWNFRRAPGFFDVVCYTGTGSAAFRNHNLGVAPELMIVKGRNFGGQPWAVYAGDPNQYLRLNTTNQSAAASDTWNYTTPTSTQFGTGTSTLVGANGWTYVAYLFASCPGVSKVGSYTGTGTTLQIDCGFTGGARFVLIKRTDSTGDWYVWDSARGIVSGNDPYLLLNSTAAEVTNTDYVDTYSAGFEISSTAPAAINANGGTFIFLAIA